MPVSIINPVEFAQENAVLRRVGKNCAHHAPRADKIHFRASFRAKQFQECIKTLHQSSEPATPWVYPSGTVETPAFQASPGVIKSTNVDGPDLVFQETSAWAGDHGHH